MFKFVKKCIAVAASMAIAVGSLAPATAQAQTGGKQLVTFGDSFTANGAIVTGTLVGMGVPHGAIPRHPIGPLRQIEFSPHGCAQDLENWPRILAN